MKGAVALTLLWALGVSAVEPGSWHHGRFEDFAEGKGKHSQILMPRLVAHLSGLKPNPLFRSAS